MAGQSPQNFIVNFIMFFIGFILSVYEMLKIRKTAGEIRSGHKLSELLTRINDRFPIIVQKLVLCVAGKRSDSRSALLQ